MITLETYEMRTAQGLLPADATLPFLSIEERQEIDTIGNTGKDSAGIEMTREEYLNSLGKGTFEVLETPVGDSGSLMESLFIGRATDTETDTPLAIEIYRVETSLGILDVDSKLPFLTPEERDEINSIAYSGKKTSGEETTWQDYLNSLGKGAFEVTQTGFDLGSGSEAFTIVRANEAEEPAPA